jgi:hypothetical protein
MFTCALNDLCKELNLTWHLNMIQLCIRFQIETICAKDSYESLSSQGYITINVTEDILASINHIKMPERRLTSNSSHES